MRIFRRGDARVAPLAPPPRVCGEVYLTFLLLGCFSQEFPILRRGPSCAGPSSDGPPTLHLRAVRHYYWSATRWVRLVGWGTRRSRSASFAASSFGGLTVQSRMMPSGFPSWLRAQKKLLVLFFSMR